MQPWPLYFVDNVITTGTTIAACRRALGWGTGLAYADASTRRNTRPFSEPTGMGLNRNLSHSDKWGGCWRSGD